MLLYIVAPWFTRLQTKHFVAAGRVIYEAPRIHGIRNAHIPRQPYGSKGILTLPCLTEDTIGLLHFDTNLGKIAHPT